MLRYFEGLLDPYPNAQPAIPPAGLLAFIWQSCEGARAFIAALVVLTAITGAFEALLFSILGHIVDWLARTEPAELWAEQRQTLLALLGVLLASIGVVALQSLLRNQVLAANLSMRLRWNFHRLMLRQSMSFFQDEFAGRIAAKVMQTALAVRYAVMIVSDIVVFGAIYFVTMTSVAAGFDAWLLLPFLGWLGLYIVGLWYFVPRMGQVGQAQADARSLMTGRVTDAYTNIATVKLFSHAQREAGFARSAMEDFMVTARRQMRLVSGFEVVNHALNIFLVAGTVGLTLRLWTQGHLGVGALAAAGAMALRLNGISHWIMWELSSLFEYVGTVQDGMVTLTRPHALLDAPAAARLQVPRGDIRFEAVSFAYGATGPGSRPVLDRLGLHVRAGEKLGLVGRSGAGKSTLTHLLLRFYDPTGGRILVDGQDIALVTQDSLRAQVGVVTQDTSLLHRSVRDNILYGRPGASDDDMIRAATRAEAHDFIAGLSDAHGRGGYDAHVGERGVKLSGGQRQRIAIARVMLKDAPILLLDEATSALDSEVEAAIQASLYRLMEGKTVLAIAHRLSTIMAMDRLIVLDQGRIVEQGDHPTLLARGGLYARLWAHQSGGFIGADDEEHEASREDASLTAAS